MRVIVTNQNLRAVVGEAQCRLVVKILKIDKGQLSLHSEYVS